MIRPANAKESMNKMLQECIIYHSKLLKQISVCESIFFVYFVNLHKNIQRYKKDELQINIGREHIAPIRSTKQ